MTSVDFGYPTPTTEVPPTPAMLDGPHGARALEQRNNVFQFIRIEDIAYDRTNRHDRLLRRHGRAPRDRRRGAPAGWHEVIRSSTGAARTRTADLQARAQRPNEPETATLSILPGANFDDGGYNNRGDARTSRTTSRRRRTRSIFTEDPGSHNRSRRPPVLTNARVWRYDLATACPHGGRRGRPVSSGSPTTKGSLGVERHRRRIDPVRRRCVPVDVQAHGWTWTRVPATTRPFVESGAWALLLKVRTPVRRSRVPSANPRRAIEASAYGGQRCSC